MLKKIKLLIAAVFFFSLAFELFSFSFLYFYSDAALAPRLPSYHWENVQTPKETKVSSNEAGIWYQPNLNLRISFNKHAGCEPYQLQTNSYGARDIERNINSSEHRVLVLGDTMMEGMGVDTSGRISDILEKKSGLEHLNFSIKNTGTLHHLETYRHLASEFDHDSIIVGIFPYDDFIDADLQKKIKFDSTYSGQFLSGDYPNYEQIVHQGNKYPDKFIYIEALLHEYTYSWHLLLYLRNRSNEGSFTFDTPSAYYYFSEDDYLKFVHPLNQLALAAPDKTIYLVSIPYINDIEAYQGELTTPFSDRMLLFAENHANVEYFDLLAPISEHLSKGEDSVQDYYFPCNKQHFSPNGYALAADILYENLQIYKTKWAGVQLTYLQEN